MNTASHNSSAPRLTRDTNAGDPTIAADASGAATLTAIFHELHILPA